MMRNSLLKITLSNPSISLSIVIWCIYIGAVIGWIIALFNKLVPGRIVRKLLNLEIVSPEDAVTAADIKAKNPLMLFLLRDGSSLRRIVRSKEEADMVSDSAEGEKKQVRIPAKSQHFYIPEEKVAEAEKRYSISAADIIGLVLGSVVLLAVAFILFNFGIPAIMNMIESNFG
ncbi:MAG: hypothetical protein J6128_04045 [Clostridia bacterium]|nr:hypothetical protein [Clostridia bacterium]